MPNIKENEERVKSEDLAPSKESKFLLEKKEKKCFVITPIGDEKSDIRRHINGVIDAAIRPALEEQYAVKAAHHIDLPGNITKQIIKEIYESDLVVANLTDRNPNVMYELALRHCFGKPTIMIAEKTTGLPSDIISERTIFYQNDAQGVLELREKLNSAIAEIEEIEEIEEKTGPIYETLKGIIQDTKIIESVETRDSNDAEVLSLLLERIDKLSENVNRNNMLIRKRSINNSVVVTEFDQSWGFVIEFFSASAMTKKRLIEEISIIVSNHMSIKNIQQVENGLIIMGTKIPNPKSRMIIEEIEKACEQGGVKVGRIRYMRIENNSDIENLIV